jgi:hypothetical protein
MAYRIVDFSDIYSMVLEELKIQPTDTTTLNRIKRDINAIYLDEVVPFKRWKWLAGHYDVEFKPYHGDGTAAVNPDSTTVTLSTVVPLSKGSMAGRYFAIDSFSEVYKISTHTAGTATLTLTTPFTGAQQTAAAFKIWTDKIALPTDCRETIEVWHDYNSKPMEAVGLQDFRRNVKEGTRTEQRPMFYTTTNYEDPTPLTAESESDRYRTMLVHPSVYSNSTTLHVDYTREVAALDLDGDEPIMPLEDRVVLVYGALSRAWARERNPEESKRNFDLYQNRLTMMAGKLEDSFDAPQLTPSGKYFSRVRGPRIKGTNRRALQSSAGGGTSYTSPTYIKNATIEGGNVTANITAVTGVTFDGRDISADGSSLDSHVAATSNVHGTGSGNSVVGTGTTQALTNKTIDADSNTITNIKNADIKSAAGIVYSKLALTNSIVNADVNSAAAIAYSKLALTGSILNADVNAAAAIAYSKLALTGSILNADVNAAAGIVYSKLSLANSIVNADISSSAAIAYSKLALTGTIVNGDIANAAAIARSKIATGTAYGAVVNDSSGVLTSVAPGTANNVLKSDGTQWTSGAVAVPNATVRTVTANDTASSSDDIILLDTTSAGFTETLPSAGSNTGKKILFRMIGNTTNQVTFGTAIDGISSRKLGGMNNEIEIVSDGTIWRTLRYENICARYVLASGHTTDASTPINFATKDYDLASAVTTGSGTWKFTAPVPGKYRYSLGVQFNSLQDINMYKNASNSSTVTTPDSTNLWGFGSDTVDLAAGEYFDIRAGGSTTVSSTSRTHISIERIR